MGALALLELIAAGYILSFSNSNNQYAWKSMVILFFSMMYFFIYMLLDYTGEEIGSDDESANEKP
ncbi:MAG TPA: hypothetical protein EYN69_10260 [Flavobacteriales bacterium]|nr:hypothetical protein [Flavobacteriales bacterium]